MPYSIIDITKDSKLICKPPFSAAQLRSQYHEIKDDNFWRILPEVYDHTQLSMETMWSLYEAVRYIVSKGIQGEIVECGVFFGGAMMLIIKTLQSMNIADRKLWLYDSFEGFIGRQAPDDLTWTGDKVTGTLPNFQIIVNENIRSTGYPADNYFICKGDIEVVAPTNKNGTIALLRLDTDTYFSTKTELEHFFPKLIPGGVIIIDDYGHALGARRATDEYFSDPSRKVLLNRVNFTNRIGIKA
jgi:O-methyltransferase